MPSPLHEVTIEFFRNQPELAGRLLREILQMELPDYEEARLDSASLPEIQPTEYRADAVITLTKPGCKTPALGVVIEVQLAAVERKRYTWPVYLTTLRARLECPVLLLVVTHDDAVARWCARPINLGCGNILPRAVGPAAVPEITDAQDAKLDPEMAVLSVMAHGRDPDFRKAARIAWAAQQAVLDLDGDRALLYLDAILTSLSEAAGLELPTMRPAGYEFQSEFVRTHVAKAQQEGQARLIIRQLTLRFGPLADEVHSRISHMSASELDVVGERLLTAPSLHDVLAPQ